MKCDELEVMILEDGIGQMCKCYDVKEVDAAIAELKDGRELDAKTIAELMVENKRIKLSAEKVLRDLLDCGLIKEWYFNGKFNAVLKADDPHLQIAELKAKLGVVNELVKESKELLKESQRMHQRCADNASKQIFRLKRALYKACANWARSERYTEATWHGDEHREGLWAEVQDKCLKKAEEYK